MKAILIFFSCFLAAGIWSQGALTLEAVVSKVLEQNYNVRIERNNVAIAESNNNIGNAGYLPTIGLSADKNWTMTDTRQEFFSGQINEKNGAKNTSANALLLLNWTFFDGFRMFATDQRLQTEEDMAGLYLTAEMEMSIYQAVSLYYTILQLQQLTPVYEQAIELSNARYNLVDLKVRNGAGTELQLIQARLDLTADSSVLLQHNKQVADLRVDLNTLMGQAASTPFEVSGTLVPAADLTWESILEQAKSQNTQLLLSKSAIAIAELQRKEIRSAYYPQLSFYAQYAYSTQQNQVGLLNQSRSYGPGVGFTLRWTILDRLSTYTNMRNSQLVLDNAELANQQQEQFIEAELRKTYNEYLWAKENLELEQQTIVNTEETFRITEQEFQNGTITALELRDIQFSIVRAKSRLLQAELAIKTAELNISLTTGVYKNLLR